MFFNSKREALRAASVGICLASVPGLNLGVVMASAMANDSGRFDAFEENLQSVVLMSALFWLPAVVLLMPALTFLALDASFEAISSMFSSETGCTPTP